MLVSEKGLSIYPHIKLWLKVGLSYYYRKRVYIGRENIPTDKPFIFAANHQCTLLDPFVIVSNIKAEPVFLTRGDIFEKKRTRDVLTYLQMLPIYRKREAVDFIERNKSIFSNCAYLLNKNKCIGIFVEGSHLGMRRLRPLKKGFARIIFEAAENQNFEEDILIVPVGINYEDFFKFRKNLLVNFGKPISAKTYYDQYQNDKKEVTITKLKDHLFEDLRELMIDIQSKKYYDSVDQVRVIGKKIIAENQKVDLNNLSATFGMEKKVIAALAALEKTDEPKMILLDEQVLDYASSLESLNFRDFLFDEKISQSSIVLKYLVLIVGLPFHLIGFVCHYFVFKFPSKFLTKKFKDKMFHSSVNSIGGLVLGTFIYPLQILVFLLIFRNFWWTMLFAMSLPITGFISAEWNRLWKKTKVQSRFLNFQKKKEETYINLKNKRNTIIGTVLEVINNA